MIIDEYLSFLSLSGIECFSTDDQINCSSFLWKFFDTLAKFLTSERRVQRSEKTLSRGDTLT